MRIGACHSLQGMREVICWKVCINSGLQSSLSHEDEELAKGSIVRFVGAKAPNNGESFEEEATEANAKLIFGKTVTLEYDTYTSDRFGRVLAYPMVDGRNVVVELARMGLVNVMIYEDRRRLKYQDELLKEQDEAKKKKARNLVKKAIFINSSSIRGII